ncbi:hypothetical protein BDQ17DRAFT_119399 [Cyathus striatus]|nr:hypothetical protein BDQ17DRAFT_119399 [Cyathus striatus]
MTTMSFLQPLRSTRAYSTRTFASPQSAKFLASAGSPASIPKLDGLPEVIVTGRANSGKSTLLNVLLGKNDMFHTSSKAGRTTTLNFVQVGPSPEIGHLVLVDAPGYGARGRPEWGEVFDHYLQTREQLKRVYILFNAKHPLNEYDHQMLEHLSSLLIDSDGNQRWTLQQL